MYKWDLGDGTTADSNIVLTTYPRKGTYKMTLNALGKGDFWAESGNVFPVGLNLSVGCQQISAIPAAYKPWAVSDLRTFTICNTELKVIGTGTHSFKPNVTEEGDYARELLTFPEHR